MGCVIVNAPHNPTYHEPPPPTSSRMLTRLRAALEVVAKLVDKDEVYLPIFDRLEREIAIEQAMLVEDDPVARARAMLRARRH